VQANTRAKSFITDFVRKIPPVLWITLLLITIFSMASDQYLKFSNFTNILVQSVPLMLVAFAQTLIVLTQGTDLSLGAQVSFVTVLWIYLTKAGLPIYIAAIISVVASMFVGSINGLIVSKGKIPPFIATLGMQNILNSISMLLTAGASIYIYHPLFYDVTKAKIIGIPLVVWITAFMFMVTWVVLYKTKLGAQIFGLGGNQEALTLAGINLVKPSIKIYAFAGLLTSVSGLITTCRLESGQPVVGAGWEFEAVAATLLGGTSLREGKGGIGGTIFGVLLITILKNGLNISGVPSLYQNAIIGLIILMSIVIDALARRMKSYEEGAKL